MEHKPNADSCTVFIMTEMVELITSPSIDTRHTSTLFMDPSVTVATGLNSKATAIKYKQSHYQSLDSHHIIIPGQMIH